VLEDFAAGRRLLASVGDEAGREARALGEPAIAARLAAEEAKLAAEVFDLAVMGEFKRGKSTLVNALIGADVLTTAVVPLTSVVTAVRWGTEVEATVRFLDGRREPIAVEEIPAYTTERGNPSNAKGVAEVEVAYPAALLRAGVRLIDTPGVGSVYEANTAVTVDFLPRADAVLFVLGADQPASQGELDFLGRIRGHVEKLFVVLNKVDLLGAADRDEAMAFCRAQLARVLGDATVRLHPLSARLALDARRTGDARAVEASGLLALEIDLTRFLEQQRATVLLTNARRRVGACLDELAGRLELRRRAALLPLETLDARIAAFRAQAERIAWSEAAIGGLLGAARRRLVDALEATHGPFVAARAPAVVDTLDAAFRTGSSRRRALVGRLQRALEQGVQAAVEAWAAEQAARVHDEVAALLDRLQEQANVIIGDVRRLVRDLFATDVAPTLEPARFSVEPPLARVDSAFSLMLDELPLLLPGPLARRVIRTRFRAAVPDELGRNLAAATAEFRQRLADAERAFEHDFRERVAAMLASLQAVLARARDDRAREATDAAAASAELEQHAAGLAALRARLTALGRAAAA
jgi:GTP-binding protein EngB required for normal cell division